MTQDRWNAIIGAIATVLAALIGVSIYYFKSQPQKPIPTQTQTTETVGTTQTTTQGTTPNLRVILHVAKDDPRVFANQLRDRLAEAGYEDPEVRSVTPATTPKSIEVRYFRTAERSGAHKLAALLRSWHVDAQAVPKAGFEGSAPLNQVEIWLPKRPAK